MEICKAVNLEHAANLKWIVKITTSLPPDLFIMSKEGFQIVAHRSIIGLLSPYLAQVFTQIPGWIHPSIHLPDVSSDAINRFLKVVYTCVSTLSDVNDILEEEVESIRNVANLLGTDIQFQAKIKPGDVHESQQTLSENKNEDISIDANNSENDYDRIFYSMEEIDCSSLSSDTDTDLSNSDFEGSSDSGMTLNEMSDIDSDSEENSDSNKTFDVTIANDYDDNLDKEEAGINVNPEDDHDTKTESSNESCQVCLETFMNKDLDEVLEHYFEHLEGSLEETCGYLISQDGKCKVCLKYVVDEKQERTAGLRHLGIDHDKLFFVFEKNGIIIPEEMFSSMEGLAENGDMSSEQVDLNNDNTNTELSTEPLEPANIPTDTKATKAESEQFQSANMTNDTEQVEDASMKDDTHSLEILEDNPHGGVSGKGSLENEENVVLSQEDLMNTDDSKSNIKRKRHLSGANVNGVNGIPLLPKRQRLGEVVKNNSLTQDSVSQSRDQYSIPNDLMTIDLIKPIVEELINSIIETNECQNEIESDDNAIQFKEIKIAQIETDSVDAELDNGTQSKEIVPNEEISSDIKTEESAKSQETIFDEDTVKKPNPNENEINPNESDINDVNDIQENDSIGESDFDTDEEDDIAQLNGLKIGNEVESEEIPESDEQQSKLNANYDSDSDQSDGKENESIGESDFDTDEEKDTEKTNEEFVPVALTDYTKTKIKKFPQPVANHILENDYNLIHIIGDGHCLFRSLSHGLGYTPDMNMHLQIRQQIAMEGLQNIRFYYKLSNYYLSEPNSIPAFEAYLKKILYGGATWGCNIDLAIASKLYQMDVYKLCHNSASNKAYYSVFSAFDGALKADRFVIIHFDDSFKGGEHYSALEKVGGNVRPHLRETDSVQSWVKMPDGTGKWSRMRFGQKPKDVKAAVEVSLDISDDSDSETELADDEIQEIKEAEIEVSVGISDDSDSETKEADDKIQEKEEAEMEVLENDDCQDDNLQFLMEPGGTGEDFERKYNFELKGKVKEDLNEGDNYNGNDFIATEIEESDFENLDHEIENDADMNEVDSSAVGHLIYEETRENIDSSEIEFDFTINQNNDVKNEIREDNREVEHMKRLQLDESWKCSSMKVIEDDMIVKADSVNIEETFISLDENMIEDIDDTNFDQEDISDLNENGGNEDNNIIEKGLKTTDKKYPEKATEISNNSFDQTLDEDSNDPKNSTTGAILEDSSYKEIAKMLEKSIIINEYQDGVRSNFENIDKAGAETHGNIDLITSVCVDDLKMVDPNSSNDSLPDNSKKQAYMDKDFIGPKIKLRLDKFEKLVRVFIATPNLSSQEIQNVSESLELSVKDGRWAFLKLKHKFQKKNKFQGEVSTAALDLVHAAKESNLQDNIFIF